MKKKKEIKAEYLPGGAKRQELLDQVPEYLEALNKATNGGLVESAWN